MPLDLGVCQMMTTLIILAHGVLQMIIMWTHPGLGVGQTKNMSMNLEHGADHENHISIIQAVGVINFFMKGGWKVLCSAKESGIKRLML